MIERIAIATAFAGIADLLSKRAVLAALPLGGRRPLIEHLVWLVDARNVRGAMDLFGAPPGVMIVLALLTLAGLAWWLHAVLPVAPLVQVGYGLVAGGALGNIVDRVAHGYVVDFILLRDFYAFNLADVAITGGLGAIALALLRPRHRA